MKNFFFAGFLLCLCCVFGACPYESTVPIDSPSVKVNQKLMGTWKKTDSEDDKYKVSAKDEFTYLIEKHTKGSKDVQSYFAYESQVNGASFLNLYEATDMFGNETEDSSRQYYLFRFELSGTLLTMQEVTENIDEEFTTTEELKKFISSNMVNSYFYTKEEAIYKRIGD